jgi:hypothetical protein
MEREPEVEMSFSVSADALRFECKPEVDVVAWADSPAVAETESERGNLPEEVEAGVTYRDVAARWLAAAALGEPDWPEAVSSDVRARRLPRNAPPQEL